MDHGQNVTRGSPFPQHIRRMNLARKQRERRSEPAREQSTLDRARNELFSAIRQCGVIEAAPDEQTEWMTDTVAFMKKRHPDLSEQDLRQLEAAGLRFCQPVIPHGKEHSALNLEDANAA
jgi:hypothetical protein